MNLKWRWAIGILFLAAFSFGDEKEEPSASIVPANQKYLKQQKKLSPVQQEFLWKGIKDIYKLPLLKLKDSPDAVSYAEAGDIAEGTILAEKENEEIYVDADPCKKKSVSFTKPYTKKEIGKVKCEDQTHKKYRVEKQ